jgi:hypothetical protein
MREGTSSLKITYHPSSSGQALEKSTFCHELKKALGGGSAQGFFT